MRGDRLDAIALVDHRLHRAKLVERMQIFAKGILGIAVLFGEDVAVGRTNDTGDGRILREPLLLHEQFERPVAAPPGRHLVAAGFLAFPIEYGPNAKALQQPPPGDVDRERVDGHASLHSPDVGLGKLKPVERNVARRIEGKFRCRSGHETVSVASRPETLSRLPARREGEIPSPSRGACAARPEAAIRGRGRTSATMSVSGPKRPLGPRSPEP